MTTTASTTTPPPLVTMATARPVTNKKHLVTQILVSFSGAVNAGEADSVATYRLATAGNKGSFTAKNAQVIDALLERGELAGLGHSLLYR